MRRSAFVVAALALAGCGRSVDPAAATWTATKSMPSITLRLAPNGTGSIDSRTRDEPPYRQPIAWTRSRENVTIDISGIDNDASHPAARLNATLSRDEKTLTLALGDTPIALSRSASTAAGPAAAR